MPDYKKITATVTMQQAMDFLGIVVTKWTRPGQARATCPACNKENRLSMNTEEHKFQCFSGSNAHGDVISLVAHCRNIGQKDAAELLEERFMREPEKPKPVQKRRKVSRRKPTPSVHNPKPADEPYSIAHYIGLE